MSKNLFPDLPPFRMGQLRALPGLLQQSGSKRLLFTLFLVTAVLAAGCAGPQQPGAIPALTPQSGPNAGPTIEPAHDPAAAASPETLASQPPPAATAGSPSAKTTEPGCQQPGQVVSQTLAAEELGQSLEFNVYLPPCWEPQGANAIPVVTLLHGQGYDPSQWLSLGLVETADRLILSGQIPPLIILMPFEQYALQDPTQSSFPALIVDLMLPWAHKNLSTCTLPDCTAVGGISRGGAWALRLSIDYSDHFGLVGLHSAPPFPSDHYRALYFLRDIAESNRPAIYLDVGESDPYRSYIAAFHEDLLRSDIDHQWGAYPGGHDDDYWGHHLEEYLLWYGSLLAGQAHDR